jgi:ATP-dependent helicase/nuclease subunit A
VTARNAASERQLQAAEPRASTWLAANAGSGKTRVLTDRVARLLLDGANPQRILCLTYTKAAASEMQNRLFRRLGSWAMLPDDRLAADLADLTDRTDPDPARLAEARRLFARAIETPGGLKIQTIHSFCATLLRRFPLEARVSPTFTEIEDRAADLMRAEIIEDMAAGPQASLVDGVARHVTDQGFEALSKAITANRAGFAVPRSRDDIAGILGLPPGYDTRALLAEVFVGGEVDLLSRVRQALASGGRNDAAAAGKLSNIVQADLSALAILEDVLLTGATAKAPFAAKIGNFPTKGMREGALAADMPALEALMARVEAARPRRLALAAADKAAALHAFARAFLDEYARRKEKRGRLDFDDLIERARLLLTDPAVAAWVLWRLDGGIDHILVDEAQDTSPAQWDVIARLAQEFSAGVGARAGVDRTLFVVGDKKQSIYSFQGADPGAFDRMRDLFRARLAPPGPGLMSLALEHSFRSSPAILSLVDQVFAQDTAAGFDERHIAFKDALPGRVDLWPVVPAAETTEDPPWTDPVDRPGARHHTVILAERIADTLSDMLRGETTIPIDGSKPGEVRRRRLCPGDILILVQRRSDLFAEIIRACKASRLPVAGADRLKVGAELAVRDLAALLRVLATPEDDLSLAATLRSPLFGWSEQDLFDLAHRRDKVYLWRALQGRGAAFPETVAMLEDLRDAADFLRPYDLIERILTRHRGRQRLIARLGAEAEDGIDALLAQALAYERSEVPSADRLSGLDGNRRSGNQAPDGCGRKPDPGDDRAWRERPGGAHRDPARHRHPARAAGSADPAGG